MPPNQAYARCWCGEPAAMFEYPAQTVTIALCKEHCAQYEVKMTRPAQYGPAKSS